MNTSVSPKHAAEARQKVGVAINQCVMTRATPAGRSRLRVASWVLPKPINYSAIRTRSLTGLCAKTKLPYCRLLWSSALDGSFVFVPSGGCGSAGSGVSGVHGFKRGWGWVRRNQAKPAGTRACANSRVLFGKMLWKPSWFVESQAGGQAGVR